MAKVFEELLKSLTLEGAVPLSRGLLALPPPERWLVRRLRLRGHPVVASSDPRSVGGRMAAVYLRHRLHLRPIDSVPEGTPELLRFDLESEDLEGLAAVTTRFQRRLEPRLREARRFLEDHERACSLHGLLEDLAELLLHIPPISVFVGEQTFTSLTYWGANLTDRRNHVGILTRLKDTALCDWTMPEQQLVFVFALLNSQGDYWRLEEMNSMQLDLVTFDRFLWTRLRALRPDERGSPDRPMQTKMALLQQAEARLRRRATPYRDIDGASFLKRLRWIRRPAAEPGLPEDLARRLQDAFPGAPVPEAGVSSWIARQAVRAYREDRFEELLEILVAFGLEETGSDFFMSRGPRLLALDRGYERLTKSDFYCLVRVRPGLRARGEWKYPVLQMAWHQAQRMQFNSWKFWYGSLRPEDRNPDQYWFHPPKLPDIARTEDRHHKGHAANGVVQSIRVPRSLDLTDIRSGARRTFHAVYDVRGVRVSGTPTYTEDDLVAAMRYSEWVGRALQAVADLASQGRELRKIGGFGKDYYEAESFAGSPSAEG